MASRAWATEVESANVRLVKVANKVFPKYSLYIVDNSDVTLGKVHRWYRIPEAGKSSEVKLIKSVGFG